MTQLISDWITVLMEGESVDGRAIEEQWLIDIAETYDPELYEASINGRHFQNGMRYGRVAEVRLSESQKYKKKTLQVRIVPNRFLLELNQEKQWLHTSCELEFNFPITNKTYLSGLALTDMPASLGTDRIEFSREDRKPSFSTPMKLEAEHIPFHKNSTFNRLGTALGVNAGIEAEPQVTPEADPSTENETMPFTLEELRTVIKEEMEAAKPNTELEKGSDTQPDIKPTGNSSQDEVAPNQPSAEFEDVKKELQTLGSHFNEMKAAFEKLSSAAPSTDFDDNTGEADIQVI